MYRYTRFLHRYRTTWDCLCINTWALSIDTYQCKNHMHRYTRFMHRYMSNWIHQIFTQLTVCIDTHSYASIHKVVLSHNSNCFCSTYKNRSQQQMKETNSLRENNWTQIKSSVGAIVCEHIETWKRLHLLHLLNHFSSRTITHNNSCSLD